MIYTFVLPVHTILDPIVSCAIDEFNLYHFLQFCCNIKPLNFVF